MKHTIENLSPVERKIAFEIPNDRIKQEIENTYVLLQKSAELKGFRKGKVPRNVLVLHFKDQVESDALSKLINDSFSRTLEENNIVPVSQPKFDADKFDAEKDYSFSVTFEIKPKVEVKDYIGLELQKDPVEVTDKDVDAVINHLRESQAVLNNKETDAAKEGDFAVTEIETFMDGKSITPGQGKTHFVEIGKKTVLPAIEDAILKMKKGEETTVATTLDEKIEDKKFAGKTTEFKIRLKEIREKVVPELNDDFARSLGPYKDVNDFKEQVKGQVTMERERSVRAKLENDALKLLIEKTVIDVPPSMVESETDYMANDYKARMQRQGMSDTLQKEQIEKVKPQLKEEATRRVKQTLILEAIAAKEKIEATPQETEQRIEMIAKNLKVQTEKIKEYYNRSGALEELKSQIRADKTLDFIVQKANIKSIPSKG